MLNLLLTVFAVIIVGVSIKLNVSTKQLLINGVIGLLLIVFSMSFTMIPTGYVGVKYEWSFLNQQTSFSSGWNWKVPLKDTVKKISLKQQKKSLFTKNMIYGECTDKEQRINVIIKDINIIYSYNPDTITYLFLNIKDYNNDIFTEERLNNIVKSMTINCNPLTVTDRSIIVPLVKEQLETTLKTIYGKEILTIHELIIGDIDFDESYNKQIIDNAEKSKLAEQTKIENDRLLQNENDKKAIIEKQNENNLLEAQGKRAVIEENSKAEADRYKILSEQITPELLKKWEMDARIQHGWITIQGVNTIIKENDYE